MRNALNTPMDHSQSSTKPKARLGTARTKSTRVILNELDLAGHETESEAGLPFFFFKVTSLIKTDPR